MISEEVFDDVCYIEDVQIEACLTPGTHPISCNDDDEKLTCLID